MRQVTFTIEFYGTGHAYIRLPEGRLQTIDAQAVADLTQKLGEALGTITERHVGDHDHHVGNTTHAHIHT